MPSPDTRGFEAVQFKSAHNAYKLCQNVSDLLVQGFRGLELDVVDGWLVSHKSSEPGRPIAEHLANLRSWSIAAPDHDPIVLHVDVKSVVQDVRSYANDLNDLLSDGLGRDRIYAAADRRGAHSSLVAAVKNSPWPKVEELRGQFLICLTGNRLFKELYAKSTTIPQLCFCDFDLNQPSDVVRIEERGRVFLNMEWRDGSRSGRILDRLREYRGFIVRVYTANHPYAWQRLRKLGPTMIATDITNMERDPWATVGDLAFANRFGTEPEVT